MPTTFPPTPAPGADRRAFLKGTALAAGAGLLAAAPAAGDPRPLADSEKVTRIASNTYPIRPLFKRRPSTAQPASQPRPRPRLTR